MKIKLIELKIENFKGIKNLVIDFAKTTHISGRNGTGKQLYLMHTVGCYGIKIAAIEKISTLSQ